MEFEKQNKLPEGVGKRIIEALKSNKSAEVEDNSNFRMHLQDDYKENSNYNSYQESEYKNYDHNYDLASQNSTSYQEEYINPADYRERKSIDKEIKSSSNIDTLVDLVTKLPPGVTKQTGAQIIRHTMEAMGIPMNKVLANAQMAQEELEQNIRNNVNIIEEYREKIKILDQEIQQFRKKAHDLEDIISLFILSENNKKGL